MHAWLLMGVSLAIVLLTRVPEAALITSMGALAIGVDLYLEERSERRDARRRNPRG